MGHEYVACLQLAVLPGCTFRNCRFPSRSHQRGGTGRRLRPAIEYISQNSGSPIRNDGLAALSGISTVYFRKLFAEVMGVSPITYTKQLRIEKAKEMLKSDYGRLIDIAQSLGYPGLYDFSRDFKKHEGVAPSKYILPQ
ncbi:MAG: helix-turn-helix transcriptional regulator [Clostridia bacterium]|nr:helix-turn-helix transcriptional regulator [Clostridia bacterium]